MPFHKLDVGKFLNVQIPTTVKSGLFQNSSFSSVKRVPDLDVLCNEITKTVQLIRDVKCEKVLDILSTLKFDGNNKNFERFCTEKLQLKLKTKKKNNNSCNSNLHVKKVPEAVACVAAVSGDKNIHDDTFENSGKYYVQPLPKKSVKPLVQLKLKLDYSCNYTSEDAKKSLFVITQLYQTKSFSNHLILQNGSVYSSPNSILQFFRNGRQINHGHRRNFKTERQKRLEMQNSFFYGLISDKNYISRTSEDLKLSTSDNKSPTNAEKLASIKNDISEIRRNVVEGRPPALRALILLFDWLWAVARLLFFAFLIVFALSSSLTVTKLFGWQPQPVKVNVNFSDAKGVDEAKEELKLIVEFLRNPSKFVYLGAKLPSGILLEGPPGTGKTLLARAIAGEADCQFFHVCGSEFDESLVGEGAKRVRRLFQSARDMAPAVIFIDEIDAVGGKRVTNSIHPYANQTINQLLAEMDGFVKNEGIVVIGATNRESDLDPALLRPGRFDLKIQLQNPDIKGRKEILDLYLSKIVSGKVDVDTLAKKTIGLSGADLEAVVNQAALKAAICGCDNVTEEHLDFALEKVTLGPELKSRVIDSETNLRTAYHESGHALVAYFTKDSNMPYKMTVIPRGKSLGHTTILPGKDNANFTKSELMAIIDVQMAGRAAEELIYGSDNVTAGCKSDLDSATLYATEMVCSWGMSENIGFRTRTQAGDRGNTVNDEIDKEIKKLLKESYERAKNILKSHSQELESLAKSLVEKETLNKEEIKNIISEVSKKKKFKGEGLLK